MAVAFFIHKMSEHMDAAQILKWHVGEGIGSRISGADRGDDDKWQRKSSPPPRASSGDAPGSHRGSHVPVGEVICFIAEPGKRWQRSRLGSVPWGAVRSAGTWAGPERTSRREERSADDREGPGKRATPAARRAARELGIDITPSAARAVWQRHRGGCEGVRTKPRSHGMRP